MARKKRQELPPIQALFGDSWKAFKGSVLNLLILNLVGFGIFIGLFIVGVIISIPLGVYSIATAAKTSEMGTALYSSLGALGIIILILIVIAIIISLAIHAASTLFVGKYKEKPAFGKTFKASFKYILPLFLVGLLTGFITAGGYFLFVIPGIFFALLFSFAPYEIILNNQGVLSSLRRSSKIVLSNFWRILTRLILWVIIVILVAFLLGILSGRNAAAGAGLSGLSFFVNIALGWFGICYHITLYKQATKDFDPKKGTNLLWLLIVGIVGWIVGIIIMVALSSAIFLAISGAIQKGKIKPNANPTLKVQTLNNSTPSAR